jgi:hypothetical protein
MTSVFYTLTDFDNIIFNGLQYTIPSEVIHNLQDLQKKLGISNQSQPTQKPKPHPTTKRTFHPPNPVVVVHEVKKEIIEKSTIEKDIATIRVCLNKISTKNYESQSQTILTIVDGYIARSDKESLYQFANTIFDISSSNTFLSELNAKLYKQLIEKSDIFLAKTDEFMELYLNMYHLDVLCISNAENKIKQNDKRKAMTIFIVNLMKEGVLSLASLMNCLDWMFSKFEEWIETKAYSCYVDEIADNLFLLITLGVHSLNQTEQWSSFYDKICMIGEMKTKEKEGLSSRAIFKFKDLIDFL